MFSTKKSTILASTSFCSPCLTPTLELAAHSATESGRLDDDSVSPEADDFPESPEANLCEHRNKIFVGLLFFNEKIKMKEKNLIWLVLFQLVSCNQEKYLKKKIHK